MQYYLQGGETKRMFKVMGLQPGDGLKLEVAGRQSGIPTTRLTIIPAGAPLARKPLANRGLTVQPGCDARLLAMSGCQLGLRVAACLFSMCWLSGSFVRCVLLTQPCPSLPLPPPTAARNPNAAAVLAAAAEQAAKREARLAANPKPPKGAPRKRKSGEVRWRAATGAVCRLGGRQLQGGVCEGLVMSCRLHQMEC